MLLGYITMGVVCEYQDTTYDLEYHLSTFRILLL